MIFRHVGLEKDDNLKQFKMIGETLMLVTRVTKGRSGMKARLVTFAILLMILICVPVLADELIVPDDSAMRVSADAIVLLDQNSQANAIAKETLPVISFKTSEEASGVKNEKKSPGAAALGAAALLGVMASGGGSGSGSNSSSSAIIDDAAVVHTPEPGTLALLSTGLAGLVVFAKKRSKKNK